MSPGKYLLFLSLIFVSCVEHTITIRVHPDGFYEMQIETSGDSVDVFNEDFTHPSPDGTWMRSVKHSVEDGDTIWTMMTRGYLSGSTRFVQDTLSIAPVQHPMYVIKNDGWISTHYEFNQKIAGRKAFSKYPILADALRSNARLDSIRWLPEAMTYLTDKALQYLQTQGDLSLEPIFIDRIKHHFQNYFIHVQEEKLLIELEGNRQDFLHRILAPFLHDLPSDFISKMVSAMKPFEDELDVTMGLQDDEFEYILLMPGRLISTNADTVISDTIRWEFDLEDFLNDDLILNAETVIYSKTKLQKFILFLFITIIIVVMVVWRTSVKTRHNSNELT